MRSGLSETEKEKKKKIVIIIVIILLLLIILLFFLLHRKTYEVTFDSNGGSEVVSVKVKDGDKVEEPNDPIKEGYIFAGWYYLNELYDFDLPVKEDMTLEAEWAASGNAEVQGIILNATDLTLGPNGTAVLVATLQPEDAKQVKLIWTSSDETIATVDENGNVKALKEGTVTITVATEDGKYSASCTLTISNETVSVYGVSINGETQVNIGGIIKLTATVSPDNATNKGVTWSSSNPYVAKVDQNGNVTGLKAGKITITVKTVDGGYEASYTITVNSNSNSNNNNNNNNKPSTQNNLATSNNPTNPNAPTPSNPSNPSNPTNPNTPSTPDNPNVPSNPDTPSNPNTPDNPNTPSSIEPTGVSISGVRDMTVGETGKLTATITPSNANSKTKLTWSSNNSNVVTVDQSGNIRAVGAGSATITVTTENGKTANITITVKNKTVEPTSVSISGARDMTVGETGKLTATITPSNANSKTKLTWSSNNSNVVTVDQSGNIRAVGAGSATITVTTENGKTASATITVRAKESTYVLYLTARVMEGTGATTQYDFRVTKDGGTFTDYRGFTYNGKTIPSSTGSVRAEVVRGGGSSATIILNDGTKKQASVVIINN